MVLTKFGLEPKGSRLDVASNGGASARVCGVFDAVAFLDVPAKSGNEFDYLGVVA
jgi:hypothetical protein